MRKFIPGNEWLYYKIYTSYNNQEKLLKNELFHLINKLEKDGLIKGFFFIRYLDEKGEHLRLRIQSINHDSYYKILKTCTNVFIPLVDNRFIYNLDLSIYTRELEKYPIELYDKIEQLFHINSSDILEYISKNQQKDIRFIIKYIDSCLSFIDYTYQKRHLFFEDLYKAFSVRYDKKEFIQFIRTSGELVSIVSSVIIADEHINQWKPTEFQCLLREVQAKTKDDISLVPLLQNIIHLMINRFFIKDQNKYETIIYFILSNVYLKMYKGNGKV